ncbi:MAG TPA: zinc ABC transporter substrate-binding protein [Mesorhizobium sp.]|jgi:zinc/manganese transport system substrate-binding protein|nr:zinc ABC transporter substrate-binding protein [Mesorhizobium sp.]
MLKLVRHSLLLGAAAFASPAQAQEPEKLDVIATFSILGDFARQVGGDRVEITTLVGPNGDAHAYEPRPADAAALANADVILVNGLYFEGFLERLVETSGTAAPVVELTKGVETIRAGEGGPSHGAEEAGHGQEETHEHAAEAGHDHGGEETHAAEASHATEAEEAHRHGDIDPHAFQSVANAKIYVKNIADAFCAADTQGCETFRANARAYTARLDALEAEVKAAVAEIPADKRVVITSHDAFGYFGHEYGIDFRAPEGVSTESEASAADVARLIEEIREEKASAVFVENVSNPRLIEQIASETGLTVGGSLYSDALSEPSGPAGAYLDLMRHNVRTLKGAILGS